MKVGTFFFFTSSPEIKSPRNHIADIGVLLDMDVDTMSVKHTQSRSKKPGRVQKRKKARSSIVFQTHPLKTKKGSRRKWWINLESGRLASEKRRWEFSLQKALAFFQLHCVKHVGALLYKTIKHNHSWAVTRDGDSEFAYRGTRRNRCFLSKLSKINVFSLRPFTTIMAFTFPLICVKSAYSGYLHLGIFMKRRGIACIYLSKVIEFSNMLLLLLCSWASGSTQC